MFKKSLLTFFILFICFSSNIEAQLSIPAKPFAFLNTLKSAQRISGIELNSINATEQLARDSVEGVVNRYSITVAKNIDIKQDSILTLIPGDGKIWRQKFHCTGAFSLGIHFDKFYIPDGALLFVYNSSYTKYAGAFSSINNKESEKFAIADFPGEEIIIEYYEPENVNFSGILKLGSITAAYKDLNASAVTSQDVVCPQWASWRDQSHAVARMTFVSNDTGYYCTGSLINTVRNDGTPYFLTANHCIGNDTEASTLITYFNYEAKTCGARAQNPTQTLSGSTLKSTSAISDFTLLELSEIPPKSFLPYFAGWDATEINPGLCTCIHHPAGTQKVAISSSTQPTTYNRIISWENDVLTAAGTHWRAVFAFDNIQPGSSGSALFDANKRIIGQLHGGDNTSNYFGKLSVSWKGGKTNDSRLDIWLDPDNTGTTVLDGYNGFQTPQTDFTATPQIACVAAPVQFDDNSKYSPTKWKWIISPKSYIFTNETDSTSQNPQVEFLDSTHYTITLITANSNGTDTLTNIDFIDTKSKLNVSLQKFVPGLSVCAYDLKNNPLVANGAINYKFSISPSNRLDTVTKGNEIYLSANSETYKDGTFDAKVVVTGSHGSCKSSDSVTIHVNIPPNDMASNALPLLLGNNGPFSNQCATVEKNEPQPAVLGCEMENSWCYDTIGNSAVQNSIWFQFNAPSNGILTFDVRGFDSQICIYQANSINDLFSGNRNNYQIIAANDNRSGVDTNPFLKNVKLTPNQKYYLQLDGNRGAVGAAAIVMYDNSLEAYPNPSSGTFSIIISSATDADCTFEIYSPMGQLVKNAVYSVSQQNNKFDIDLSDKASGIYSLVARIGDNVYTRKILIIRPSHQ